MTAENLLKPRWIVIADFPNSDFKVGEIEDREQKNKNTSELFWMVIFQIKK